MGTDTDTARSEDGHNMRTGTGTNMARHVHNTPRHWHLKDSEDAHPRHCLKDWEDAQARQAKALLKDWMALLDIFRTYM